MSTGNRSWEVISSSPTFGRYSTKPIDLLENAGATVTLLERGDSAALAERLRTADAWIVGFEPVDESTLADAPGIRVVAKCGAGIDNFDLDYLKSRGIAVVSVPGGNSQAVAEYAMTQILSLARGPVANDAAVRSQAWKPNVGMGLGGRTLGIVGFGAIGRFLAELGTAFGMRIITSDPVISSESAAEAGAELVDLPELLAVADVVSLHVPLMPQTRHMISTSELASMKPTAYLINSSRGGVVDELALHEALSAGTIAGAALDVFETEPVTASNPLLDTPNLILSPHTAGYSDTALGAVTLSCAEGVLAALQQSDALSGARS